MSFKNSWKIGSNGKAVKVDGEEMVHREGPSESMPTAGPDPEPAARPTDNQYREDESMDAQGYTGMYESLPAPARQIDFDIYNLGPATKPDHRPMVERMTEWLDGPEATIPFPAEPPIETVGRKTDNGKIRMSLMPEGTVKAILAVLEHGARTYQPDGWKDVPNGRVRYLDALHRHLLGLESGWLDTDSGLPHLAHVLTNAAFLLWMGLEEK